MHRLASLVTSPLAIVALAIATPAAAEMISAKDPDKVASVIRDKGYPVDFVSDSNGKPYIESESDGIKFVVFFMNCDDDGKDCTTIQFFLGFTDAKDTTLEQLNEWNATSRFGRAYRDEDGDPVMEMDVDLDFDGLPRENVGEYLNTWLYLMDKFHSQIFGE